MLQVEGNEGVGIGGLDIGDKSDAKEIRFYTQNQNKDSRSIS